MQVFSKEQDFISYLVPIAQRVCKRYGYKASILVAQVAQEVGFAVPRNFDNDGIYDLLRNCNLVGQKADLLQDSWKEYTVWDGRKFWKTTPEEQDGRKITIRDAFRIFDSDEQSLCDYILFLLWAKDSVNAKSYRYGPDVVNTKDPHELIIKVGKKYATDSSYAKSIWSIVQRYNLTKYDDLTGVKPTDIIPPALKEASKVPEKNVETIKIIDRTKYNTPPRWGDTRQALVFHFLGVAGADNPDLYDGGYGAQWYISRKGDIYHSVKKGGVTWSVGSGGWGKKTEKWNNDNTESVEMGCENDNHSDNIYDKKWWFHMVTQETAVKLARYWLEMRGFDVSEKTVNERILIHNSITNKPCPAPWLHCANYKSPNEKGHRNWTFEEFKKKIWQGYTGKTISGNAPTPTPTPEPVVEKWYRIRKSWSDAASQIGAYKSLDNAKENCPKGYAVYDWNGKEIYRPAVTFADKFLAACKNVADTARIEKWTYGDSHTTQPCADHVISCDRLPSRANYDLGYTDQRQGGETCGTLPDWLPAHGWKKVTKKSEIKPGAIVAVKAKTQSYINHVFTVVSYDAKTDRCTKYDTGSNERIKTVQPFKNVALVEWPEREFVCAWNVPDDLKGVTPKKETRKISSTTFNGVNYHPVYNYNYYKNKYADLRKAFGTDKNAYFKHFCEHGMKEGRQAASAFNVTNYKKRYADLRKAFGDNLPEYYKHYCLYGKKENRNAK